MRIHGVMANTTFLNRSVNCSLFIDPDFSMFAILNIFHQNDYNASQ